MVESLDGAVGKILQELTEDKLTGDSVVIFTSDNGGTASARPTGLNGTKGTTFEGGIRVPCIVRWPGVLPAKTVTEQVGIVMDLTASAARIAGARVPRDAPFDGIDIFDRVARRQPSAERTLFWRGRRGKRTWWGVRAGAMKYVARREGATKTEYLFDLRDDPAEKTDLGAGQADEAGRIRKLLSDWEEKVRPRR